MDETSSCKNNRDCCKMVRVWTKITESATERQGASMFPMLEGQALHARLEFHKDEISRKDGIKTIMARLHKLYNKKVIYLNSKH